LHDGSVAPYKITPQPGVEGNGSLPLNIVPEPKDAAEFDWNPAIARLKNVHGFNSMNARSRSFNLIRAKLTSLGGKQKMRMIGVVSATPNVGKSFVSANLAAAMSRDPRMQTYLVDMDLRRGTIKDLFGIATELGLATYFESALPDELPPSFRPSGENLIILPNVPALIRSAELLAGERSRRLLQAMRESAESNFYIFDLPPVFANDDAANVVGFLDGYAVVAEEGQTTQREIEAVVDMLGDQRFIGVILNKYRGGLVSEGRGIEERYAGSYYGIEEE
jgi:protein-tyrosine kinase